MERELGFIKYEQMNNIVSRYIKNQKKKASDLGVSDVESIDTFHNRGDDNNSLAQSFSNLSKGLSETARNRMNWVNNSKFKDSNLEIMPTENIARK